MQNIKFHTADKKRTDSFHLLAHILCERKLDVNLGKPLIFDAIRESMYEVVELVLSKGCNTNLVDAEGLSPLAHALAMNDLKMVQILLGNGADPNIIFPDGISALEHAFVDGHEELVRALVESGALLNFRVKGGYTPFQSIILSLPSCSADRTLVARLIHMAEAFYYCILFYYFVLLSIMFYFVFVARLRWRYKERTGPNPYPNSNSNPNWRRS